jgi:hypothetical protein
LSKKYFKVELIGNPCIVVREVLPTDDDKTVKEKNKKPFMAIKSAVLKVKYDTREYTIANECGYTYDGASIPFKIGKGNMKLLIPSLYHDIMCENKAIVDFDRKLSSLIFKELLIQCKVNKLTAEIMYESVNIYQCFMRGWK